MVNRSGEHYDIELLPPSPGEYVLKVFGKQKDDVQGEFPEVMEYKVVELSGSNRSFPIVYDEFFDLGLRLDRQINGTIETKGDANLTLWAPANVLVIGNLEKSGQDRSASKDYSNSIFVQRSGDQYKIYLSPPSAGEYILNIFAKRKGDNKNAYSDVMQINVSALSGSKKSFPETFDDFQEMGVYLFEPLTGEIKAGDNQTFKFRIPDAEKVALISGDKWNYLTRNGDIYQGNIIVKKGDVDIAVKFFQKEDYSIIIKYSAI